MVNIKTLLDDFLLEIKKENPSANFRSLITGIVILFMVGTFSIWYFAKSNDPQSAKVLFESNGAYDASLTLQEESLFGNEKYIPEIEYATVEKGEGLWHVAKRVCGDGEDYKYIASANGLNIHRTKLSVGQKLVVTCDK